MGTFWSGNYRKAVTFSYDDGVTQDIRMIELLNDYGLKATFNLNSELLGQNGMLSREGHRICHYKVQPQDVREIYDGHEVAVHTLTHPNLTQVEDREVLRQVREDKKKLEDLVGYEIVGMAYPGGGVNYNQHVAELIREHTTIQYCRTTVDTDSFAPQKNLYEFKPNVSGMDWERMTALAQRFLETDSDQPQIFYIWGHAFEMDYTSENWSRLERFFRLISGHQDIFYGTNREVLLG